MDRPCQNLEEFIATQLSSLDHLRALLFCRQHLETEWDALEAGKKLGLPSGLAGEVLAELAAKRLLLSVGDPCRYRYQPQSLELAHLVEQLADMDRSQPVTLVNLIAPVRASSRRPSPLSSSP